MSFEERWPLASGESSRAACLGKRASRYSSVLLSRIKGEHCEMSRSIFPVNPQMSFAGVALTVELPPGDGAMLHMALALAMPGDVLVIDGKGDASGALMDEFMTRRGLAMGLAAVVMNGAPHRKSRSRELGLPMFCAKAVASGKTAAGSRINHPVSIGGIRIHAGDLVVGDSDGVAVIRRENAESVLSEAEC